MVQIAEYTRRETFNATERPSQNLNMPDAMARGASGSGGGLNISDLRTVAKGAEEIAGHMLDMKERYDKAKAQEYLNNYMQNAQDTILGYKKERLGKYANGVVSDFEEWSEKEFSSAMGRSEQSSEEPLLENSEQIKIARDMMDKLNLNYVNQLSSFQAEQLQKYEDNQATALLTNQATLLSTEDDVDSIKNSILTMRQTTSSMSQFKGQSQEYIDAHVKPIVSKSLSQNVMSTALSNPDYAITKMENDLFYNNMEPEDYADVKDKVSRSFKSHYVDVFSDYFAYDETIEKTLDELISRPFFNSVDKDKLRRDILVEASEKRKEKAEKQHKYNVDVINQITTKMSDNGFDMNALSENEFNTLASMEGGEKTVQIIKKIQTDAQVYDYNLNNGIPVKKLTKEDAEFVSRIKSNIDAGHYETIGDLYEDVFYLPSPSQMEIVGRFVNDLKYKKDVAELKSRGIDVDSIIKTNFKDLIGFDSSKSRNVYNVFRNKLVDGLRGVSLSGGKIDNKSIQEISLKIASEIQKPTTDENVVIKMMKDLETRIMTDYGGEKIITDENWMSEAKEVFDDSDIDISIDDETENAFVRLLVIGDVDAAVSMIRDRRISSVAEAKQTKDIDIYMPSGIWLLDKLFK